jgi:GMP synthase-like glutamine amidotransferase
MPEGAELLATNKFCQNAMYSIEEHILTIQAHPEFCKDYCRKLIDIRREMIGAEVSDRALESMQLQHEGELFARWMIEFIKN